MTILVGNTGEQCKDCNLKLKFSKKELIVVFHNLKGYDSHLIISEFNEPDEKMKDVEINCIPNNMQKFMSFSIKYKEFYTIKFIDSYVFMAAPLDALSNSLNGNLPITRKFLPRFNINCKAPYPYDYIDAPDKFKGGFPEYKHFYNRLYQSMIV